jgi:hypothetical protein
MLDFKTQSQLVDATASIMRAYLKAATNTVAASTSRSMTLWSEMLEAATPRNGPAGRAQPAARSPGLPGWPFAADWMLRPQLAAPWPAWPPLAQTWWLGPSVTFWAPLTDWGAWSRGSLPTWSGWNGAAQASPSASPGVASNAAAPSVSDGGFASYRSAGGHAAAQVIVPTVELAGITAKAALSPMETMLGVWRAALGA